VLNDIFLGEEGRIAPYACVKLSEEVLIKLCRP